MIVSVSTYPEDIIEFCKLIRVCGFSSCYYLSEFTPCKGVEALYNSFVGYLLCNGVSKAVAKRPICRYILATEHSVPSLVATCISRGVIFTNLYYSVAVLCFEAVTLEACAERIYDINTLMLDTKCICMIVTCEHSKNVTLFNYSLELTEIMVSATGCLVECAVVYVVGVKHIVVSLIIHMAEGIEPVLVRLFQGIVYVSYDHMLEYHRVNLVSVVLCGYLV